MKRQPTVVQFVRMLREVFNVAVDTCQYGAGVQRTGVGASVPHFSMTYWW